MMIVAICLKSRLSILSYAGFTNPDDEESLDHGSTTFYRVKGPYDDSSFYSEIILLIQPNLHLLPTLKEPENQVDLHAHEKSQHSRTTSLTTLFRQRENSYFEKRGMYKSRNKSRSPWRNRVKSKLSFKKRSLALEVFAIQTSSIQCKTG